MFQECPISFPTLACTDRQTDMPKLTAASLMWHNDANMTTINRLKSQLNVADWSRSLKQEDCKRNGTGETLLAFIHMFHPSLPARTWDGSCRSPPYSLLFSPHILPAREIWQPQANCYPILIHRWVVVLHNAASFAIIGEISEYGEDSFSQRSVLV